MISLPLVVEPPDLVVVEVLEASARAADLGRTVGQARRHDLARLLR